MSAGCAGFVYSLVTAAQYVATGCSKLALVIGADCTSRILDPKDQRTYPLFGDGAGAVLVTTGSPEQGLVAYPLGSDGSGAVLLNRPVCGSQLPPTAESIRAGPALREDGRPGRIQMGRARGRRFGPQRAPAERKCRRPTST